MKWETVKIAKAFKKIANGLSVKQSKAAGGLPVTRIETIWNGEVDETKFGYAGLSNADEYAGHILNEGDLLMSHINSWKHLGKTAIFSNINERVVIHGMNLLRLQPNERLFRNVCLVKLRDLCYESRRIKKGRL